MVQNENTEQTAVRWEEPDRSPGDGRNAWPSRLAPLRERPGSWAVVAEDVAASTGGRLKKDYPEYEFTNRGIRNNRAEKLYARYVGTDGQS